MAKEREEWQFVEEGCWQTPDKRFMIIESQSGEYHHLVDNQRLRNSKTFKDFAECDDYAWKLRNGQVEVPAGKNRRRYEDEGTERSGRQGSGRGSGKGQDSGGSRRAAPEERPAERAESGGGRNRRNSTERNDRKDTVQNQGKQSGKNAESENGRAKQKGSGQNRGQNNRKEAAGTGKHAEKTSHRKRHHNKGNAAEDQAEKDLREFQKNN